MPPLVSICLPNLNTRLYLGTRMESILAQTLTDWELIVCDSFSDDGSWEFFQQYPADSRIHLHQVPRAGLYAGWNECLKRAQGEYVYFATSDDTAEPQLLEKLVQALERAPDADLAVCRFEFIDEAGIVMRPAPFGVVGSFHGQWLEVPHRRPGQLEFLVHTCLDCPSWTTMTAVVFRRRLLEKTGGFRTDCGPCADRLWAMRTALATDTISIPDRLATWRRYPAQATGRTAPIKGYYRNFQFTRDTIDACEVLIPDSWKEPKWRDLLLHNVRNLYFKRIGLDRATLAKKPVNFLRGMAYAALHEPRYLADRLSSGLAWRPDQFGDEEAFLRDLIKRWNVPGVTQLSG